MKRALFRADATRQSDFIVYVDESGDHSLDKIDAEYPVFVLAFCVFYKDNYVRNVVSALERLKFDTFGHDIVVLHERDIRKETGQFRFRDKAEKGEFIGKLTAIIDESNFILISCIIDKIAVAKEGGVPANPYHIALGFCLESLFEFVTEKGQHEATTYVVFECRGDREDKELELEFRRLCDSGNARSSRLPFEIVFADKRVNSAGLQLADLVARPVGLHFLRPGQKNRAFDVLERKFFCRGGRKAVGEGFYDWGLKIHPKPISEKPR